ncbi:uncharacterized protein LOC122252748 [Penaeus japonicus]|uniref:uncharacterized protein LOC122252748 n=1 Tax=Penaeus japonicus TaxID=27405 RepID=UPI001C710741|nr:uncharacterized protein LOC122252748 [Penaeus japonicus]
MASCWAWIAASVVAALAVASASSVAEGSLTWDDDVASRLVTSDVSPARIVDVMANILVRKLKIKNEDSVKQLRAVPLSGNQEFDTDNGKKAIRIEISSASFTNMGSLRRSRKTTLNSNRHLLSGSFSLDNVRVNANYKLSIDKIGEAPANTASGQASLVAEKVFADFVFMVDGNGLPAGIQSWRARVGRRTYLGTPNLNGNPYKDVYDSVLDSTLRSLVERLVEKDLYNLVNNQVVGKMELQ